MSRRASQRCCILLRNYAGRWSSVSCSIPLNAGGGSHLNKLRTSASLGSWSPPTGDKDTVPTQGRLSVGILQYGVRLQGQDDVEVAARAMDFVVTGALGPDATAMGLNDAAGDGQPQAGAATLELADA